MPSNKKNLEESVEIADAESPSGAEVLLSKEEMELEEEINIEKLRIIRDNFDYLYENGALGRFVSAQMGYKQITDKKTIGTIINDYFSSKKKSNIVKYKYANGKKSGRMFSVGHSLQNISRKIRGCISKGIYIDIDMVNCHVVILKKFCEDNEISTPNLDSYIENRDEKLKDLMGELGIDRDTAKTIPLSIINGGFGGVQNSEGSKVYSKKTWLKGISEEIGKAHEVFIKTAKGKKIHDRISKNKDWNIAGSVMNCFFCEQENILLVCLHKYLQSVRVKTGAFVFDGLMIRKDSMGSLNIDSLLLDMEKEMFYKLGYDMRLSHKEFEDIDLTGLEAKKDIDLSDSGLADIVLKKISYKYHAKVKKFYIFNEENLLWMEYEDDAVLWKYSKDILTPIIIENLPPNSEELEKGLELIKKASKMGAIVKFIKQEIKSIDHSDFIDTNFNNMKGIFPIKDGLTVDLKTGKTRPRIKEDYFTMTTKVNLTESPNTSFVREYFKEVLSTTNEKYIDYVIDTMGYILTAENNLKRFFVMIGPKDTGKSLFLEILEEIFGGLGGPTNSKVFLSQGKSCHDNELFTLENKRYASMTELSEDEKFNETLIKKISGYDKVNARRCKSDKNEEKRFHTVMLLATNKVPTFSEKAFGERMRVLSFNHVFTNNPSRKKEILKNLDSFFSEFVKGATRYYNNSMEIEDCEEVKLASQELVKKQNPVFQFWEDQTEYEFIDDKKKRIKKSELYQSYKMSSKNPLGKSDFHEFFLKIYEKQILGTYNQGKELCGIQRVSINSNTDDDEIKPLGGILK